jgi:hypothetical protein
VSQCGKETRLSFQIQIDIFHPSLQPALFSPSHISF